MNPTSAKLTPNHPSRRLDYLALLTALLLPAVANAQQTVRFATTQPLRVTVPVNSTVSTTISNYIVIGGGNTEVDLSVSGLPVGASASFNTTAFTTNGPAILTLNTINVAEGVYTFSLNATGGATNNVLVTLQVGYIWTGSINTTGDWSSGTSWLGGVAPGPGDDVIFTGYFGGQTNLFTNSVISADMTIGSLRFASTNANTSTNGNFHTVLINPGQTLSLTGTNGLSCLQDVFPAPNGMTVTIRGPGASMVMSNPSANIALLVDNQIAYTLDMSLLDNFSASVNRVALGDYALYPNFWNLQANGYNGLPRRFIPTVRLAKNSVIRASYVDPFNYTNADNRNYGLSFLNSEISGTSTQPTVFLGVSNVFLMDSVNFVGGNQQGKVNFNPTFYTNGTSCYAYFRATNGGRMSVFSISDASGTNGASSNIKSTIDFGTGGGSLDVLADRLYIGRDRKLIASGQNPNYQGFMMMGKGLVDVNTAILGFQELSGQTNTATFNGYCEGVITVSNSAVFKVNQDLILSYCTQTDPLGLGSGGNTTYGKVIVVNGGLVMANLIEVGIPAHTSKNNTIVVGTNSTLMVSNTIASPAQMLDSLTLANGSVLTLHLDGNKTTPYVYTTNLVTAGRNAIQIASIRNLGALGAIPLIQFSGGNGSFQGLVMPAGLGGALLTTNNVGIYLTVLSGPRKNIVWRGYANGNWDQTTLNWLDLDTGLQTNFVNGDLVFFDDDPASPATVHLAGPTDLIPGSVTMTNSARAYIIDASSGGDIQGSATWSKWGSNSLEIDAPTTIAVQLNQGTLVGNGSIGSAAVAAGAAMNFSGNFGNGISCAGIATLSGNGSGILAVLAGGTVTNTGTFTGPLATASGALLVNTGTINNSGNSVVSAGATLLNAGSIQGLTLTVNGTLEDTGVGNITLYGDTPTGTRGLTISPGGVFIPGGDGIGTTTIAPDITSPNNFPGRVLLSSGSTNIFKVDPAGPTYTKLLSGFMGFGPNQNFKSINGGTIVISNVSATPFSAGQSFAMFQFYQGGNILDCGLNTTNSYPIMVPPAPGPGLAWDISTLYNSGVIGIIGVSTTPTNVTAYFTMTGTNIISELSWPANYIGWRLQTQSAPLNVGLTTNWVTLSTSVWTNDVFVTNALNTGVTFYRLVYP